MNMTPERRGQIEALYQGAMELQGEERTALLAQAAPDIREEVETMLGQPPRDSIGPGMILSHYRVETAIGAGAMGTVFRAVDTKLHRPVAIKILSGDLGDVAARRRFQREAQM